MRTFWWVVVLAQLGLVACGPVEEPAAPEPSPVGVQSEELESLNGLSLNGLSLNGLSLNGLSPEALSSSSFASWFSANPVLANLVMKYVIRCAVPANESRSYTDASSGRTYSWTGGLGLTPDWASGQPASVVEQQLVTGCLAAHVNAYGLTVPISVLANNSRGQPIPAPEVTQYTYREACFFGNLFNGEGVFAGNDRGSMSDAQSSVRLCGRSHWGKENRSDCPPLVHTTGCEGFCQLDATGTYYTSCVYKGVTYVPVTTRLRPQDVYVCGDGVCQFTESCGLGLAYNSCLLDCGSCLL